MAKDNLDALLEQAEEKIEKGEALDEIETEHHGKVKEVSKKESVASKIKESKLEKKAEEASIAEDAEETGEEKTENKEATEKPKKAKKAKQGKAKIRSKKYQEVKTLIEANKKYEIADAIELVKKSSYTKFDGNVEAHIRVLGKSGKPEQLRGMVSYPHSNGKKMNVVVLDEKTIEEIAKSGKVEADIYLATPENMPKVVKLAKILGPKGKMPNPKNGTITDDIDKAKEELSGGKVEYKADSYGIIHQVIGKVSGKDKELTENYQALVSLLPKEKIVSINLCATMGPSVKVQK